MKAENTGLIILAAGGSHRLGRSKQLLPFEGSTLLSHCINQGLKSVVDTVLVVLGAHADQMKKDISAEDVHVLVNTDWQEGIASSIRLGLKTMMNVHPVVTGVVIMLCDQPYVTTSLINSLVECQQNTGKLIIASKYDDVTGVPAYFHISVFPELLQLQGDIGARSVIQKHINDVATVDFPEGIVDIDTEADYKAMMKTLKIPQLP